MKTFEVILQDLRRRLNDIDRDILTLVAERKASSGKVARVKYSASRATSDYEREVVLGARTTAQELGISPDLAGDLLHRLIRASFTTQEQASVPAGGAGSGRRALVIGGGGKMGRWFVEFLGSQGFSVEVADPQGAPSRVTVMDDWRESDLKHDLIVLATPLTITNGIFELALRRPPDIICEVGLLKSPLRAGLLALRAQFFKIASERPRNLVASTLAEQVMNLDDRDRLIAYVLGLSHALNMAFFAALADSGEVAPQLARLSSTTFDARRDVASRVAEDSPQLYYEPQSLNDYGAQSLDALSQAVEQIRAAVASGGHDTFVKLMQKGSAYLTDRQLLRERL